MNLPRLAIEARHEAEENCPDGDKETIRSEARLLFLESVRRMSTLIADQLYDRYCYQRTALARQFPFMMGNDVWKGGAALEPNEEVGDVIKSGTLGIGFIGGHNAMVAIYGEGHAHNKAAWNTLYDAISVMNDVAQEYKRIAEKIKCEAPFHAITGGGHITYVELDGEAKKNVSVILKIVKMMKDENIGYGSINHPVDTCKGCGFKGVIYDKCPVCGSDRIARLRRITGYLTGSLDTWNSAKQAEEHDRVKHL